MPLSAAFLIHLESWGGGGTFGRTIAEKPEGVVPGWAWAQGVACQRHPTHNVYNMKIGLILPRFVAGGAERVVLELAGQFKEFGHQAVIVSLANGGNMVATFERSGLPLRQIGIERQRHRSPRWLVEMVGARRAIADLFSKERFDVIHTHLMGPDIECVGPACEARPKVLVHTIHNTYGQFASIRLVDAIHNWRRRRAYAKYDHIVAVHDEVKNWAIDSGMIRPEQVSTVHNGLDFSRLDVPLSRKEIRDGYGWAGEIPVLLNVGSLTEQKNQLNLVRGVSRVIAEGIDLRLVIAGEGPLRRGLDEEIQRLGLQCKVQLLGYRTDVPLLLKSADLFVLPSLWEGLPICVLEAMASGIPVLVSDIAVHSRILASGELGALLVSTSPEGIAESIVRVLRDLDKTRQTAAVAAVRVREEFSARDMALKHLSLYARLQQSRRAANRATGRSGF